MASANQGGFLETIVVAVADFPTAAALNGERKRRRLTVQMIYLLNKEWKIPAELLIQPYELSMRSKAA